MNNRLKLAQMHIGDKYGKFRGRVYNPHKVTNISASSTNSRTWSHYRFSSSNDKAVICLHGAMETTNNWFSNSARFNFVKLCFLNGYDIVLPESGYPICPNSKSWHFGQDGKPSTDLPYIENILTSLRDTYQISNISLVGMSAGSFMASLIADMYPAWISKVVMRSGGWYNMVTTSLAARCNPTYHNTAPKLEKLKYSNLVKFHLSHGQYDRIAPVSMSVNSYAGLISTGNKVEIRLDRAGHSWPNDINNALFTFINR